MTRMPRWFTEIFWSDRLFCLSDKRNQPVVHSGQENETKVFDNNIRRFQKIFMQKKGGKP